MATSIVGSLAVNPLITITAHAAGSLTFGPIVLPAGYTTLLVLFDLQQVSSQTAVFSATIEVAPDGQTFVPVGGVSLDLNVAGFTLNGSTLTRSAQDPLGAGPVRCFGRTLFLPHCDLATRQIQGVFTCSEALISGVSVVAF